MALIQLLLRTSRAGVLLSVLLGLVSGASSAGLLSLINQALATEERSGLLPAFVGLCILLLVTKAGTQLLVNRCHQDALLGLRLELSNGILRAPLRRLEELGAHRLTSTLITDVQVASGSLIVVPHVLCHLAVMVGCLVYLVWLSVPTFLATLGLLAVGFVTYWVPSRYALRALGRSREELDTLFRHFQTLIQGTKELKLHRPRRDAFVHQQLHPTLEQLRRLHTHSQGLYAVSSVWGLSLFFFVVGLLLFALSSFGHVRTHELVGFTLTLLYLQQPLDYVMGCVPTLSGGNIALGRIQELQHILATGESDLQPVLVNGGSARDAAFSVLELRGLTHTYHREQEDRPFILGPLHLTIRRGELLFVVGGNGSGKTTLAKLITGLYTPEGGRVVLDGEDISDENRERYRQLFTTVFSDFYLFESMLGLTPDTVEERAQGHLERLQLSHKVRLQDGVLSTTALSMGQRKRLALLTAYLEDRPIYLFDEWAADQDPEFKRFFYEVLLPDLKHHGKTVVAITHDDRYFHLADRIVRLENGQVREAGALQQLPEATGS
ncbi:cyclic peptide export ABC transporter [Myxococcus stipitatus]|uniref:cyclic peptide export ABC transporter n=1 Tax=Myxococcus stipitatus TaxID=83455 RepID=UPI001F324EF3|nr:cyclic peptide export ABC transporter [Myxococcus stipitatus]MCE9671222.1 cyclic peptide export ABC transporter [Myxococcus stipitatus]